MTGTHIKAGRAAGPGFYQAEAAGLAWLATSGGPPVPRVHHVDDLGISMDWVAGGRPSVAAARQFGRELARMHAAGAPAFGAAPPGAPAYGWIGELPMAYGDFPDFPTFWAQLRLLPAAHAAAEAGGITHGDLELVTGFCAALTAGAIDTGPVVEPARLHGDLWSGNVLWGADGRVWLIDPAAHGGHPSSDLAMLALFGCPHLDVILAAHAEESGIAALAPQLLALHQLWPLLVHAALFGAGYGLQAMSALRRASG